jgi:hypothetical protein
VYVRRLGAVPTGGLIFGLAASGIFLFLCYNLIRGAWTDAPGHRARIGNWIGLSSLQFPVDKTPEIGYMGWKQLTEATLSTVRKDRK